MTFVIDGGWTCSARASWPGVIGPQRPIAAEHGDIGGREIVIGDLLTQPAGKDQHRGAQRSDGLLLHGLGHIVSLPH